MGPFADEPELHEAAAELEAAIASLRRAQAMWTEGRAWSSAANWDVAESRAILDEAGSRLNAARLRVEAAARSARRRELATTGP